MTELLTTGKMIDRLKVGQLAEVEEKAQIPEDYGRSYKHVTKIPNGDIKWCTETGTISPSEPLILYGHTVNWKWRILPNYVSFAEAMKAIEEGKDVHCQYNDEAITIKSYDNRIGSICFGRHCESGGGAAIKIAWIVVGKWTIKED